MENRILRINQLIRRELSQIILRQIEFSSNTLVTVTRVRVSPDLSLAKVYISCLPEDKNSQVLRLLRKEIYQIQRALNKRLTMKKVPRIRFVEEVKTKEAGRIERILEEIQKKD